MKEAFGKLNIRNGSSNNDRNSDSIVIVPSKGSISEESSEYGDTGGYKRESEFVEDKIYEEIGEYYDSTYLIPKRKDTEKS